MACNNHAVDAEKQPVVKAEKKNIKLRTNPENAHDQVKTNKFGMRHGSVAIRLSSRKKTKC